MNLEETSLLETGFICPDCNQMQKHLELDLEFGKIRETLTCQHCRESFHRDHAEPVYTQSSLRKILEKNVDMFEGARPKADTEEAMQKLKTRAKQTRLIAKQLGLENVANQSEEYLNCVFCGRSNKEDQVICTHCTKPQWKPEKLENQ